MDCLFAVTAFILTALLTALLNKLIIPVLRRVKLGQKILEVGPNWHKYKEGTPTMGGITFILPTLAVTVIAALIFGIDSRLWTVIGLAFVSGLTGFVDDYVKLFKHTNKGLSAMQKLILQFAAVIAFLAVDALVFGRGTSVSLAGNEVDFGLWYYIISLPLAVYVINASNLTDGIDGLEISVSGLMIAFFGVMLVLAGNCSGTDMIFICAAFGGCAGFWIFNHHPAKIFMGDTGSLYLGGLVVGLAYYYKIETALLPITLIWIIEGLSVVLQVICFKLTKKRLFKMAPIHHHFEKCGWSENKIVAVWCIVTAAACTAAYFMIRNIFA